jgi:hypothetical protein
MLLTVLVDAQPPDLRFQRLPWNTEFRCCTGRTGYPSVAVCEGASMSLLPRRQTILAS